jgi:acyl-CoA-binding protein
MSDDQPFRDAQQRVEKLSQRPGNDELLELYGLYKQATAGDVSGKRPGMLDLKGRAKHDAWSARKGMSKDDAMRSYVETVDRLAKKYGGG